ncbi:MAG: hypothetical protein U1D30_07120 [Planctomycetota bacterium]
MDPIFPTSPTATTVSACRDIEQLNATTVPDHLAYAVVLADGSRIARCHARGEGRLLRRRSRGAATLVTKEGIEEIRPTTKSIMPGGTAQNSGK